MRTRKTKVIRAQFYFQFNEEKDKYYNQQLDLVAADFKDMDVYYSAYDSEIGDDKMQVVLFDVETRAFTYKEAEALYKMFKRDVVTRCGEKCYDQIVMKLEKVI